MARPAQHTTTTTARSLVRPHVRSRSHGSTDLRRLFRRDLPGLRDTAGIVRRSWNRVARAIKTLNQDSTHLTSPDGLSFRTARKHGEESTVLVGKKKKQQIPLPLSRPRNDNSNWIYSRKFTSIHG